VMHSSRVTLVCLCEPPSQTDTSVYCQLQCSDVISSFDMMSVLTNVVAVPMNISQVSCSVQHCTV